MNREIKFRALVQYHGKEAYWEYYEPLAIPYAFTDQGEGFCKIIVKNLEYTGLKDKNGKEIYEGDIIKTNYHNFPLGKVDYFNASFVLRKGAWVESVHELIEYKWQLEITGNKYENPELLV